MLILRCCLVAIKEPNGCRFARNPNNGPWVPKQFEISLSSTNGLFTWSGGPRSSGVVGCLAWGNFHAHSRFARSTVREEKWGLLVVYALEDTKQKKPTPLDRGLRLHVNRV